MICLTSIKRSTDYFVKKKLGIYISDDETKNLHRLLFETEQKLSFTRTESKPLTELEAPNDFRYRQMMKEGSAVSY